MGAACPVLPARPERNASGSCPLLRCNARAFMLAIILLSSRSWGSAVLKGGPFLRSFGSGGASRLQAPVSSRHSHLVNADRSFVPCANLEGLRNLMR